jgi:hypothetical protein
VTALEKSLAYNYFEKSIFSLEETRVFFELLSTLQKNFILLFCSQCQPGEY